ncbi:MAG: hypothetical protein ACFE8U_05615 [Candidatus Hermodarchaeota archaeon]
MSIQKIFHQVFIQTFLDSGPAILDYFSFDPLEEDLSTLALRFQLRVVEGLDTEKQKTIYNELCGPDTAVTGNRTIWYNWKIRNHLSKDKRILKHGVPLTIFLIYKRKDEDLINASRGVIEEVLSQITIDLLTISDVLNRIFDSDCDDDSKCYQEVINNPQSRHFAKYIIEVMTQAMSQHYKEISKSLPDTTKFKIILKRMIFKEGLPDAIEKSQRKEYWQTILNQLNTVIGKLGEHTVKSLLREDLLQVYRLLTYQQVWRDLPITKIPDHRIQESDVSNFFFWAWLGFKGIVKKNWVRNLYLDLRNGKIDLSDNSQLIS